jgi:hypothetical protein
MALTIFSNFKIDSKERLLRMKDSFHSFKNHKINQWVINVRGKYKLSAIKFLDKQLNKKLHASSIETGNGWFFDTKIISKKISNDYILYWVEDHICICGKKKFNNTINEIKKYNIEYIPYSFFGNGLLLDQFKNIKKKKKKYLFFFKLDKLTYKVICKNTKPIIGVDPHILGLVGIFKKEKFLKILNSNRLFLRRYPKDTPFDFEKSSRDTWVLPFKIGIPKYEMFTSIDDDNRYYGSSLISRKLYPNRISRFQLIEVEKDLNKKIFIFNILKKIVAKIFLLRWLRNMIKRISYHF